MSDVKIFVKLNDPDLPDAESMRAEPLGRGRYRLLNVPFYARELALDDTVLCAPKGGELWLTRRLKRSGNGTIRIFCRSGFDASPGRNIVSTLQGHGYAFEFLGNLAAGAIPASLGEPHLDWLEEYLKTFVSDDLFYEIPVW